MTIFSVLLITPVVLAHVFINEIEERTSIGLDMVMMGTGLVAMLLILAWFLWFLFFSRLRWWRRVFGATLVGSIPFAFFLLFRPVNGGDANIVRFEPIWAGQPVSLPVEVSTDQEVDLGTETAADYPQFLGPGQSATLPAGLAIDADQFSQARVVWKKPIGLGWSGFAARNGFAVTMEQRDEFECVTCYEIASGDVRWVYKHKARHHETLGRTGPRSTPTIHNGRVYAIGAVGNFVCLDGSDGSVVWQKDLNELLGLELGVREDRFGFECQFESNSSLNWGRSGSPLIVDDLVVIPGGGPKDPAAKRSTLLAFNHESGELKWRAGSDMIGYASPQLETVSGVRQLLITGEDRILSFDPQTGEQLWSHPRPGQSDAMANTSQLTVLGESQILSSKGYPDGGGELLRLENNDGKLVPRSQWKSGRVLKTKLTSPVVYQGHSYSISNGFMECARVEDGTRVWKQRGRFGHGQLLLVGDKLLVHSESGTLYLLQATPEEYRELGSLKTVDGVCWNTLCLYGDLLVVRSELEAACVEIPVQKTETL